MFEKITSWKRYALTSITAVFLCAHLLLPTHQRRKFPTNTPAKTMPEVRQKNMRYILQWNEASLAPLSIMGQGSSAFIRNACEYTKSYVTSDRTFFTDVSEFDAIVFNGRTIEKYKLNDLPLTRSPRQKYVFANMESSHNYPVCSWHYDDYFNWTWTYKLNSDSRWGYFTVFDSKNAVVAPKVDMRWPELDPVNNETKRLLHSKSRAAAWFVSNCQTLSRREVFAAEVARELKKYNLSLDIYGSCGGFTCEKSNSKACMKMLAKDYYFYFAFEKSLSEDYVTEKVLTALNNYAIPVVYGGANYSRFLPAGSYLEARALPGGAAGLAARMAALVSSHRAADPHHYYDFFRWRNHYTFRLTFESEDVCNQCRMLNDPELVATQTSYRHFRAWWNSDSGEHPKIPKYFFPNFEFPNFIIPNFYNNEIS